MRLPSVLALLTVGAVAQQPDTDLWIVSLSRDGKVSKAINCTVRPGYDNQPQFSRDGRLVYYASVRDGQSDIYAYAPSKKKTTRITTSEESEYSPRTVPGSTLLSAVVVERDSSQRVHLIDPLTGAHVSVLPFDSVGYTTWISRDSLLFYKLTAPHSLRIGTLSGAQERWLADTPGRGFVFDGDRTIWYTVKDSGRAELYAFDLLLQKGAHFGATPNAAEDLVWHSSGLLVSSGAAILRFNSRQRAWETLLDLSPQGITHITRFALDTGAHLLVVADNKP